MSTWANLSNVATGAGTLVLAVATFGSVRSANRSARIAEQALLEQRRPVLVHSRLEDPLQKIMFVDERWVRVSGSRAVAEQENGNIYLALSLRNVGTGMAVLQSWVARPVQTRAAVDPAPEDQMHALTRDLYVPGGDVGIWQGALRDPREPIHAEIASAITERRFFTVELLYSDNAGGQRTISRFSVTPVGDDEWMASVGRHWYLDRDGPR